MSVKFGGYIIVFWAPSNVNHKIDVHTCVQMHDIALYMNEYD